MKPTIFYVYVFTSALSWRRYGADYKNKQISPEIINNQKGSDPSVQEGRSLLKKTEGACPKRITTTHGEYTALQWTTVGGARNLHRKSNCHNSWFTPFSLIKDLYLTSLNKKRFLGWKGKNYYPIQIKFISYVMRGHTIMLNHNFFKLFQNKPTWN